MSDLCLWFRMCGEWRWKEQKKACKMFLFYFSKICRKSMKFTGQVHFHREILNIYDLWHVEKICRQSKWISLKYGGIWLRTSAQLKSFSIGNLKPSTTSIKTNHNFHGDISHSKWYAHQSQLVWLLNWNQRNGSEIIIRWHIVKFSISI